MQTEPPPRANFCETVNQWVIYDSYVAYETAKEVAEEKEMKKEQKEVKSMRRRLLETPKENSNDEVNKRMLRAAKILERMVNQNTYDEIAQGNIYYLKNSNVTHHTNIFQISVSTRMHRTSSASSRARCCRCGSSGSRRRGSWRSRRCAGTPPTTTSSPRASAHVGDKTSAQIAAPP